MSTTVRPINRAISLLISLVMRFLLFYSGEVSSSLKIDNN